MSVHDEQIDQPSTEDDELDDPTSAAYWRELLRRSVLDRERLLTELMKEQKLSHNSRLASLDWRAEAAKYKHRARIAQVLCFITLLFSAWLFWKLPSLQADMRARAHRTLQHGEQAECAGRVAVEPHPLGGGSGVLIRCGAL